MVATAAASAHSNAILAAAASEPRLPSLAGIEIVRPQPVAMEDVSKNAQSRRAQLPRSQSTGNMLDAIGTSATDMKYELQNIHEEPSERTHMRDLAKFFRTTAPPQNHAQDNGLTFPRSGPRETKKHLIQSLIKRRRATKIGTQSLQLQLSDKIVTKKTIEGYPYTTIVFPDHPDSEGSCLPPQEPSDSDTPSQHISGPPQWPERTTSKAALSPTSPTHALSVLSRFSSQLSGPNLTTTDDSDGAIDDDLKKFTEARLLTAEFLRKLAQGSQEVGDQEAETWPEDRQDNQEMTTCRSRLDSLAVPTTSSKNDDHGSKNATIEFPPTPPHSGRLQQIEWPDFMIQPGETWAGTSMPLSDRRRQSSSSRLHNGSNSSESCNPPKKSLRITTHGGLAVPERNLLPESPGFPKLLAAMTFPSPPTASRSSSPVSPLSSGFSITATNAPSPIIRPRTSSRKASTSSRKGSTSSRKASTSSRQAITAATGTVSLNELVMRPPQSFLPPSRSDYNEEAHGVITSTPEPGTPAATKAPEPQISPRSTNPSSPVDDLSLVRLDSVSSFVTACEEPQVSRASSALSHTKSYRQSLSSSATATESNRQSTSTQGTNRHSIRSDATTASTAPSIYSSPKQLHETNMSSPPLSPEEYAIQARVSASDMTQVSSSMLPDISIAGSGRSTSLSIAERRMARKGLFADSRERKISLDGYSSKPKSMIEMLSFHPVDSPVLGWFTESNFPPQKAHSRAISPLVEAPRSEQARISTEDVEPQTNPSAPVSEQKDYHDAQDVSEALRDSNVSSTLSAAVEEKAVNLWSLSPIMATVNIEPEQATEAVSGELKLSSFTISPLIVVANVEPELVSAPHTNLQASNTAPTADTAPHPPPKSPYRPRFAARRLSRQVPLPVRVSAILPTGTSPSTTRIADSNNTTVLGRSSSPVVQPHFQPRSQARLSLPIYITTPNGSPIFGDRHLNPRQRESQVVQQHDSELEPKKTPRRRSIVIRERLQQVKMAREKELVDLVAKAAAKAPFKGDSAVLMQEECEQSHFAGDNQISTTDELERRLQRLEKHSDEWRSVLDPLLSNMNQTLQEAKIGGEGGPLLMEEFIIDMTAEATRSILSTTNTVDRYDSKKEPVIFEDFDGAYPAAEPRTRSKSRSNSRPEMNIRIKKTRKDESQYRISRLRLPLEQPQKTELARSQQIVAVDFAEPHQILTIPEDIATDVPRTPQQHEFEVETAIRKRINAQEAMMDELMTKWAIPRVSQDLASPMNTELLLGRSNPKRHSKSSSLGTVKPVTKDANEQGALDGSISAVKSATLAKNLIEENDGGPGRRNSRRGSRRWSSAGERTSWHPGQNGSMNTLMQELRATCRLSIESKGDVGSLFG